MVVTEGTEKETLDFADLLGVCVGKRKESRMTPGFRPNDTVTKVGDTSV